MTMITVNGKEFDTDDLSEEAIAHIDFIRYTDAKLADIQRDGAVLQTARIAYSNKVSELLKLDPVDDLDEGGSLSLD